MENEDGNEVIVSMISLEDIIIDRLDASSSILGVQYVCPLS